MPRNKIAYRTASKENYISFCKEHPEISVTFEVWKSVVYGFSICLSEYILETGVKCKLPFGLGTLSVAKRKTARIVVHNGISHINLPVDWVATKAEGKKIYNMNHHTDGYRFKWIWTREKCLIRNSHLWVFKPCRILSRKLAHRLMSDQKYQFLYREWLKGKV